MFVCVYVCVCVCVCVCVFVCVCVCVYFYLIYNFLRFKPRQYIIISAFSGPVPQSSAHPIELMTPDVLDARTSEPQLDFSDEEENFEEEPVPLTELEIGKMEVKALASQLVSILYLI